MHKHRKGQIALSQDEIERYARHLTLEEIGISGQEKLKASSVLCIGCGGLGSPLLLYLAAAGIGRLGIVDCDKVEGSNLQRQIIHSTNWIGRPKTNSASSSIYAINPFCKVEIFNTLLTKDNAFEIMETFEIICDCTDNFPSRYLINDACFILGKPNIYGSVDKFEGQVTVFNLNKNSPNFRDLIPEPPPAELVPTCGDAGVIGTMPGLIGIIQAAEVIKIITNIGNVLDGRILIIDLLKMRFKELCLKKDPKQEPINRLIDYNKFCSANSCKDEISININIESISVDDMYKIMKDKTKDILILDVREAHEAKKSNIPKSILIPLKMIENESAITRIKKLSKGKKLYVYCKSGRRSTKAIIKLKSHGINSLNIAGGIDEWNSKIKNNYH